MLCLMSRPGFTGGWVQCLAAAALAAAAQPAPAAWWNPFGGGECLQAVTDKARAHQQCLVAQQLPGQCNAQALAFARARGECEARVKDTARLDAAEAEGRKAVAGDPARSPFRRIQASLKRAPYFIRPERANYLPFSGRCRESTARYFKIGAYHLDKGTRTITFIAYPLGFKCAAPRSISDKFPVVTEAQLGKLAAGAYLAAVPRARRPFARARVVRTTAARLKSTYRRVVAGRGTRPAPPKAGARRHRLTVITSPAGASVRVLNVRERYRDGIELPPGRYLVEVSAPGYRTHKQWVRLHEDHEINIALARARPFARSRGLSCLEHKDDISVSTVRIAPFNECHFITYPDERSRDLAIVNRRASGHIHDIRLEVTYYDAEHQELDKETYVLYRAADGQAIPPGETRFPVTGIYLKREDVHAIGIKTVAFSVSS